MRAGGSAERTRERGEARARRAGPGTHRRRGRAEAQAGLLAEEASPPIHAGHSCSPLPLGFTPTRSVICSRDPHV